MTPRLKPLPHLDDLQPIAEARLGAAPVSPEAMGVDAGSAHEVAARCTTMAETVSRAARTMNELIERNTAIREDAEKAIAAARTEAREHRERSGKIEAQLEAVREERQRILQDGERRIRSLTEETNELKDRLEKAAAELIHTEQWLEYLNTRIKTQLEDVFARTDTFWASRRVDPST